MTTYVIDASVILSALLETKPAVANRLRQLLSEGEKGNAHAVSTAFLPLEVANGLRFSLKNSRDAKRTFEAFMLLPIRLMDLESVRVQEALTQSFAHETSVYDASYHMLAKSLEGTFYTCDTRYYQKAKSIGNIELLS